jgi:hypothetical protein
LETYLLNTFYFSPFYKHLRDRSAWEEDRKALRSCGGKSNAKVLRRSHAKNWTLAALSFHDCNRSICISEVRSGFLYAWILLLVAGAIASLQGTTFIRIIDSSGMCDIYLIFNSRLWLPALECAHIKMITRSTSAITVDNIRPRSLTGFLSTTLISLMTGMNLSAFYCGFLVSDSVHLRHSRHSAVDFEAWKGVSGVNKWNSEQDRNINCCRGICDLPSVITGHWSLICDPWSMIHDLWSMIHDL